MPQSKRAFLLTLGAVLSAGCVGTVDEDNENTSTNESLNESNNNNTVTDSLSLLNVTHSEAPNETPQDQNKFLFIEHPENNTVVIAKTVAVHNGCASPDGDATTRGNEIEVMFESVDDSSNETMCTTAIEPTPFAIEITLDALQSGISITATGVTGERTMTYETTGENTETILPN